MKNTRWNPSVAREIKYQKNIFKFYFDKNFQVPILQDKKNLKITMKTKQAELNIHADKPTLDFS